VQANPSTVPGAYQGNLNAIMREVSPGITVAMNVPTDITSSASPPPPLFDQVFAALNQLQTGTAPATVSTATIQSSITSLDTALNAMLTARAQVGAKTNRLDFLSQQLNDQKVSLSSLLSQVKDVDMAQAITNFSMAQQVYQASLKAGAQALQPSLLDYLH
jgi:flagellar hook-associated protein 3 FlgL